MTAHSVIVVPCYNEAARLDLDAFVALSSAPATSVLFVNDGSRDETAAVLEKLCARSPGTIAVHHLQTNSGKGEAVRQGLLKAIEAGATRVAYFDADLATPPDEVLRLLAKLDDESLHMVLGSRIRLMGRDIERRAVRHYFGRVFATCASLSVGVAVYDTQCGAKAFRVSHALGRSLRSPFVSKWAFDVELLGRVLREVGEAAVIEVPLRAWRDVGGSKLTARGVVQAFADLATIAVVLRRGNKLPPPSR